MPARLLFGNTPVFQFSLLSFNINVLLPHALVCPPEVACQKYATLCQLRQLGPVHSLRLLTRSHLTTSPLSCVLNGLRRL